MTTQSADIVSRITSFLAERHQDMLDLLREMVLIQSNSHNKNGLDCLSRLIAKYCTGLGMEVRVCSQDSLGDHLVATTKSSRDGAYQLLIGHMDTVFPENTAFNWYREDGVNSYGPGVADMKGGLVVGLFALAALQELGRLDALPIRFIFNSDEEIDSPGSRGLILEEARRARRVFVLECGGPSGQIVTSRKGRLTFDLKVRGQAGHAAFAGQDKASAILELAHQVIALEELNNIAPDLTINVGTIHGGIGPNTVPEDAGAAVDVRYAKAISVSRFREELTTRTSQITTDGTSVQVQITSERPPMKQSQANLALAVEVIGHARRLGQNIDHEFRAGGSDANLVAETGLPVVDGLGPVGGLDHSDREYIVKHSLIDRSALLSLCLLGQP